jgi:N-acetylglucosaminyldiphosphoundecaprenol N-acetyl-beta-D-mannosaminyltransferase
MVQERITRTTTQGVRVDAIPALDDVVKLIHTRLHGNNALLMTFVNPGTAVMAQRNPEFARLVEAFDVVAPDGIGMSLAIQWLHKLPAKRISFDATSLAPIVLGMAAKYERTVAVCGGQAGIAEQAAQQLRLRYPTLQIVGTFDGFSDKQRLIEAIHRVQPQIVICGMGSLVQESFLLALLRSGWQGLGFTCGGFLDQLSNGFTYYPAVIDHLNLRWAYRLAKDPRRLWRRYLLDYPVFAFGLCKALSHHE